MNRTILSIIHTAYSDQRGQVLPWVTLGMVGFLGLAGLTIDVGKAYVAYDQLQASTNAAALAAAGATYNSSRSTVASQAKLYGADSGGKNASASLGTVYTYPSSVCLNILMPVGTACTAHSVPNAVKVTQTAAVPTYFLRIFGINSIPIQTVAQAAMQGVSQQWNVAIIVDTTLSMSSPPDSSCNGASTRLACAMNGVQAFLGATNPCAPGYTNCASSHANVHVSVFTFPNPVLDDAKYDYNCTRLTQDDIKPYTFPAANAQSYSSTNGATYQITGYLSDYYLSSASNRLNSSSQIVKSMTGCLQNPGGMNTYYAGAIYAAQASLLAEQKLNSNSSNAIILLSDGQAQAGAGDMDSSATLNSNGNYPSYIDDCQQAIKAANDAAYAGTRVYAVAYGSSSGTGCNISGGGTDSSLISSSVYKIPLTVSLTSTAMITPCITMKDIASDLDYFYADSSSANNSCTDGAHSTDNLQDIFLSIASSITNPQLLPKNAK